MLEDTVAIAATLSCVQRLRGQRPPGRLHLQLSFYRVSAAEVKAAQQPGRLPPRVPLSIIDHKLMIIEVLVLHSHRQSVAID